MPVNAWICAGAGASSPGSPRNLLSTKPRTRARSCGGSRAQVPYRCANAPPRSMSVTSRHCACAWRATRILTISLSMRLISAGEPAPSMTTTSFSARRASSDAAICGQTCSLRWRHGDRVRASSTLPSSTTWLRVSASGLSSRGFMRTSGTALAARAWKYWAEPISPMATTRALLLMFCALKGATFSPCRAYQRHKAVASQLLPAPLVVPSTMTQRAVTGRLPPRARRTGPPAPRAAARSGANGQASRTTPRRAA